MTALESIHLFGMTKIRHTVQAVVTQVGCKLWAPVTMGRSQNMKNRNGKNRKLGEQRKLHCSVVVAFVIAYKIVTRTTTPRMKMTQRKRTLPKSDPNQNLRRKENGIPLGWAGDREHVGSPDGRHHRRIRVIGKL
jgi:hypothetical protein